MTASSVLLQKKEREIMTMIFLIPKKGMGALETFVDATAFAA